MFKVNPYRPGTGLMPTYLAGRDEDIQNVRQMFLALTMNIPTSMSALISCLIFSACSSRAFCWASSSLSFMMRFCNALSPIMFSFLSVERFSGTPMSIFLAIPVFFFRTRSQVYGSWFWGLSALPAAFVFLSLMILS